MKQSNNKKSRDVTAFLYERLSRDDNLEGESYSIGNQKKLLTKVAKEKGYTNLVHFLDDGISGVTMDRPGFVEMIQQLEQGKAAAVFVKDLSRLGRNYIEVGRLTEEFFPEHDIRLVAVSDNIDTAEGDNELAPIRNLFNEWYARDISKKRRISNKIKGNGGEPMGQPPYGYMKDPDNPKRWIVDDEGNPEIRYFNCSNYKGNRGTCTSTHYVRVDFLEQVVLGEIKRLTKFASRYEDDFVKAVMGSTQQNVALDRKLKEKELAALQARDEELDGLFERIYEDNVSGKLSDDRFVKMSRRYEDEQKEISEKIKTLRAEMDKLSSKSVTADMFISTVRKYTRAKVLTPRMLNELIDHIEVHQAEKIDGIWEQHLVIHYNCVGVIFIPDVFPLPAPQVSVNTRKGVVVNYAPGQLAV